MASNKCFNDDLINATLNVRSFVLKEISDTIPITNQGQSGKCH